MDQELCDSMRCLRIKPLARQAPAIIVFFVGMHTVEIRSVYNRDAEPFLLSAQDFDHYFNRDTLEAWEELSTPKREHTAISMMCDFRSWLSYHRARQCLIAANHDVVAACALLNLDRSDPRYVAH